MIRVRPDKRTEKLLKLLGNSGEMKKRLHDMGQLIIHRVASDVYEDVVAKAPNGPGVLKEYPKSLKLVSVEGDPTGETMAITSEVKADLDTVNTTTMVAIFTVPRLGVQGPVLPILAGVNEGVWAIDKLPPVTISQGVKLRELLPSEVSRIRAVSITVRPMVDNMLKQAGVKFGKKFVYKNMALVDMPSAVLRAEFGLAGSPRSPHWRGPISKARRGVYLKQAAKDPKFVKEIKRTLLDSSYRPKPEVPAEKISLEDARKFEGFQDMVRPPVKRPE